MKVQKTVYCLIVLCCECGYFKAFQEILIHQISSNHNQIIMIVLGLKKGTTWLTVKTFMLLAVGWQMAFKVPLSSILMVVVIG